MESEKQKGELKLKFKAKLESESSKQKRKVEKVEYKSKMLRAKVEGGKKKCNNKVLIKY